MSSVCDLLPKPKTDRDDKYYSLYKFVKRSPVDLKKGYAEENLEDGYNQGDYVIYNITDAYMYLRLSLEYYYYPSKTETHKYKGSKLYGTFEINTTMAETISTNRARPDGKAFKFTVA